MTALNLTSESSISVSWYPVPDGHVNGLLMGYIIKYKRIRTAERNVQDTEELTVALKPNKLSTVLHVQTDSVYRIKVAAFTQTGMGPFSKYTNAGKGSMYSCDLLVWGTNVGNVLRPAKSQNVLLRSELNE